MVRSIQRILGRTIYARHWVWTILGIHNRISRMQQVEFRFYYKATPHPDPSLNNKEYLMLTLFATSDKVAFFRAEYQKAANLLGVILKESK